MVENNIDVFSYLKSKHPDIITLKSSNKAVLCLNKECSHCNENGYCTKTKDIIEIFKCKFLWKEGIN